MSLPTLTAELEVKSVDALERIIEGYAAHFRNRDRHGDIIQPGAFDRSLRERPDIAVFIGHDTGSLPVGEPLEVRPDGKGLYTKTRIYQTHAGDDLLRVATARLAAGKTLGMSIGYRTRKEKWVSEISDDGEQSVRHLIDVDLFEYSYLASPELAANPEAVVTGTKDGGDGPCAMPGCDMMGAVEIELCMDHLQQLLGGEGAKRLLDAVERKAAWTTEFINDLPDSAFAYIEPGGEKDEGGKTTPRSLRHFPHHGTDGKLDLPHLRNALSRAPQSPFGDKAMPHLERHADEADVGKALAAGAIDTDEALLRLKKLAEEPEPAPSAKLRELQMALATVREAA